MTTYGLSEQDMRRLKRLLAAFEGNQLTPRNLQPSRLQDRVITGLAKADSGIAHTTADGSAPKSGTFSLFTITSTGGTSDTGIDVTAYNFTLQAGTSSEWLMLRREWGSGKWCVDTLGTQTALAKADSQIGGTTAAGGPPKTGTCSIFKVTSTGGTSDTGINVTGYNFSATPVATGEWIQLKRESFSRYWVVDFEYGTQAALAKADSSISGTTAAGGPPKTGTCSIFKVTSTGGTSDTGVNVTGYNFSSQAVSTGQWIQLKRDSWSKVWMVDFESCT